MFQGLGFHLRTPGGETVKRCLVAFVTVLAGATLLGVAAGAPALPDLPRPAVEQSGKGPKPVAPRPLEAIDRELFAPEPKKAPESSVPAPKGTAAPSAIAEQMLQAARRIREADAGPATQELQRCIVAGLEELLRQSGGDKSDSARSSAAKAAQQGKAGSQHESKTGENSTKTKPGPQPNPGQAASGRDTPGTEPLDAAGRTSLVRRVWGDLPERQRNEILQLQPPEEFLPKYDLQIEAYFKRLSEPRSEPAGSGM